MAMALMVEAFADYSAQARGMYQAFEATIPTMLNALGMIQYYVTDDGTILTLMMWWLPHVLR